MPDAVGAHCAAEGSFTILDYPPDFVGDPGTAYVETRTQGIYYEQAEQVGDYRRVFERLQVLAARPEESRVMIREAERRYR